MALSYRGGAEVSSTADDAAFSVNLPVGTAQDDVSYAGLSTSQEADADLSLSTSGYTELCDLYQSDTSDASLGVYRKVQGATPDSAVAANSNFGGSSRSKALVVHVWIGADTTTPEDATTTTATGANSGSPDGPSITTVTAGAEVLSFGASSQDDATITGPSGYSNVVDIHYTNTDGVTGMVASKNIASANPEDPGAWTVDAGGIADSWCAATVAVRPGSVAAPSGTGAQTIPSVTQAGSGGMAPSGTGAQTIPSVAQAGNGTQAGSSTITLTDVTILVYQRDGSDEATVTFTGTYTGTPDHIQYRIVDDGTDTPIAGHDWTTEDATPSGGTFSLVVTGVQAGGWYNVDVRIRNSINTVLDTSNGSVQWGVGDVIVFGGQSHVVKLFEVGIALTPNSRVVKYTDAGWSTTIGGDGAIQIGNQLEASLDVPIALLHYGVGGSALRLEADSGSGYWLDTNANEPQDELLDGVSAATDTDSKIAALVWTQGGRDAASGLVTEEEYLGLASVDDGLEDLFAIFRATITGPAGGRVPIIVIPTGRNTSTSDANMQAIRRAQLRYAAADSESHVTSDYGLELVDSAHLTAAEYIVFGDFIAGTILIATGDITAVSNNPRLIHVEAADATVTITLHFDQNLNTAVTNYATRSWYVDESGTPATVSSVTRTGNRTIDIVLSAAVTTAANLRIGHKWGSDGVQAALVLPQSANIALPNAAGNINLPAEPFDVTLVELNSL